MIASTHASVLSRYHVRAPMRQANSLIPLNVISDQALSSTLYVLGHVQIQKMLLFATWLSA